MIEFETYKQELNEFEPLLEALKEALHLRETTDQIAELTARTTEPGFWDDVNRAQTIQVQLTTLQKKVDLFHRLEQEFEDLQVLNELGMDAGDPDVAVEVGEGLEKFRDGYEKMRLETLLTGEYDNRNAILSLHAGAGGTEAQDWAQMLYRMYMRWAEDHGYAFDVVDYIDGDEAGIKSVTFTVSGENAYGYLRSEMGVHRLVRISPFDSSGRRHTSFAALEVMPEIDDSIHIEIRPDDLKMDVYRASGAGGQHVNKTSSAVRLTHLPTGVVVA